MPSRVLHILIADAQARVRFGLRLLLDQQPGWRVTAVIEDAQALLSAVRGACPDVVLVDWDLPGIPAGELLLLLRETCPAARVILMSGNDELRQAALLAGADVFAYKADPPEKLLGLIRDMAAEPVEATHLCNQGTNCGQD